MASRADKKANKARSAIPYAQRLISDEYVQEQLSTALMKLQEVYARAARQRGRAAEDKKLYDGLREAATSIRRAVGAIQEPPPKPKHRGRRLAMLALAAAGAALLAKQASS